MMKPLQHTSSSEKVNKQTKTVPALLWWKGKAVIFLLAVFLVCAAQLTAAPKPGIAIDQQAHALVATEGSAYEWFFEGRVIEGAKGREVGITKSGQYTVKITDAAGAATRQQVTVAVQPDGTIKKIFLIGDSTVQNYDAGWYPQTGWGQVLPHFFQQSGVQIINKAVGGTSSKSFYDSFWTQVINEVAEGDYVFIQFGHNDYNPNDPARNTDANTTYKQYLINYITQTRAKNAFPVLVTPVHRNNWSGDQVTNGWRGYPQAMREVAIAYNVPLIDLHNRSEVLLESVGRAYAEKHIFLFFMLGEVPRPWLDATPLTDGVHFQEMGAIDLARLIVDGIKALPARAEMAALVPHLKPMHQLTVTSNITENATLTRTASFPAGVTVTVKGSRPSGYHFSGWTDSNSNLVNMKMTHSFTMPDQAMSLQANFTPVAPATPVAGGTYRIEAQHSQLFLDLNNLWRSASSPTANGTQIVQYQYNGNLSQHWKLNDAGGGYYFLTSVVSNKSMDVTSKSTADGAVIAQYTTGTSTSTNQHFRLEPAGDNTYQLIARHSGKCLQLTDGSTASGAIMRQVTCGSSDAQKFIFHQVVAAVLTDSPEERALAEEMHVFPNPSQSAFRINTSFRFSYQLFDELGRVQEEGTGYQEKEIGTILRPGMYFLKVQNGQKFRFIKLIKQ